MSGATLGEAGKCRSCGSDIFWGYNEKSQKRMPTNPDGVSHFATCPQAEQWRSRAQHKAETAHLRDAKMPNELSAIDRAIRQLPRYGDPGMFTGTVLTIRYISGFEIFNTRPYHNYENWATGYVIETYDGLTVSAEDLDHAIHRLGQKIKEKEDAQRTTSAGS